MPFAQSLQGRLVGLAIDGCQASNRLDGQTMLKQGFVDKPFQDRQRGVSFTSHTEPKARGMPMTAKSQAGANHQIWLLSIPSLLRALNMHHLQPHRSGGIALLPKDRAALLKHP
jgi:hypothetical protein